MGGTIAYANKEPAKAWGASAKLELLGKDELSRQAQFGKARQLVDASIGRAIKGKVPSTDLFDPERPHTKEAFEGRGGRSNVLDLRELFTSRAVEGRSVNTLQEWEGVVDGIENDVIRARLRDLTGGRSEEVAEIPLSEIPPESLARVRPGALFHFIIGFSRRNGIQRREAIFYFRKYAPSRSGIGEHIADLLDQLDDGAEPLPCRQ